MIFSCVFPMKNGIFADDTNLFISGPSLAFLETKANLCLKQMEYWFSANKLSLNTEKTCYTIFLSKYISARTVSLNLYINNQKINRVLSCKYLGVIIDEFLKWNVHIDYVCKKLIKFTSIFYKIRNIIPRACLLQLYYAFIHPHVVYGIEVYANTCKAYSDKLYKLNNKLLRILLNKKLNTPTLELYTDVNVLPLPLLHEFQVLILVHKCLYSINLLPIIFHNYFTVNSSVHNYNTRRNTDLHLSTVNINFGKRNSFSW